jgi:hypothetical protein
MFGVGIALGGQGRDQFIDLVLGKGDAARAEADSAQARDVSAGNEFFALAPMIHVVFKVSLADSDALARHFGP